jgi:hypothetical protein
VVHVPSAASVWELAAEFGETVGVTLRGPPEIAVAEAAGVPVSAAVAPGKALGVDVAAAVGVAVGETPAGGAERRPRSSVRGSGPRIGVRITLPSRGTWRNVNGAYPGAVTTMSLVAGPLVCSFAKGILKI